MDYENTSKTILSVTVISMTARLLSLVSTQLYIAYFGVRDPYVNVYSFALIVPNTIFTSIGTMLTTVVVPTYASLRGRNDKSAKKFLDDILSVSSFFIFLLIVIGMLLTPYFFWFSEFYDDHSRLQFGVFSLRVLMPVMFFYGLNFVFQGVLQSHGKFLLPAAVAIPSSLTVILYVLLLGERFGLHGLVIATLLGLSAQSLVMLPAVWKLGYRYRFSFDLKSPDMRRCFKMAGPVLVAASAYAINTMFNNFIALNLNWTAMLNYVYHLIVVSVTSFVFSVTAVYYPKLSVEWGDGRLQHYRESLVQIMKLLIFILVPAAFGLFALRYRLFDLLARWGEFTAYDVVVAGNMMALYALGILSMGFKEVLDRGFYAQKNTKVSAVVGFCIMGLNIVFTLLLVRVMGIFALPLSYSVSTTVGVVGLLWVMRGKTDGFGSGIWLTACKTLVASVLMLGVVYVVMRYSVIGDSFMARLAQFVLPVISGMTVYFVSAYFLKIEQLDFIIKKVFS